MKGILLMMYLITSITMLSSFSTFLIMKKCNRVVFQSMRSGAVHHNGAQCCMRDFKNSKKQICCEGYSKACSRKILLWSLSSITSKKKFRNIKKIFLATIFFINSFFCGIASLVSTTYIFFIKIVWSVFKKNHFSNFSFPLHNSQKNEFLGLSLGEILLHMDANL